MVTKLRKIFIASLYILLLFAFIIFSPSQVNQIGYQQQCLVYSGKKICSKCIISPEDTHPLNKLKIGLHEFNSSFVVSFNSCKRYSCKQTLQFVDFDKFDLATQQIGQVNQYLRELQMQVVQNNSIQIQQGKSFVGYSVNPPQNVPTVFKYITNKCQIYNFTIFVILTTIALVVLYYSNLKASNNQKKQSQSWLQPLIILIFVLISIWYNKTLTIDNQKKQIITFAISHCIFFYYLLKQLNMDTLYQIVILSLNIIIEICKIFFQASSEYIHFLMALVLILVLIYLINKQSTSPMGQKQLSILLGLVCYNYCYLIYDKTRQNEYLISSLVLISGLISMIQVYNLQDKSDEKVKRTKKLKSSEKSSSHLRFEQIQQEQLTAM